jgi:hypothetical protein
MHNPKIVRVRKRVRGLAHPLGNLDGRDLRVLLGVLGQVLATQALHHHERNFTVEATNVENADDVRALDPHGRASFTEEPLNVDVALRVRTRKQLEGALDPSAFVRHREH